METKNKESVAYKFIKYAWDNEKTNSYSRINALMDSVVSLAIMANMEFGENDFEDIKANMSGGYWFGCNQNRSGYGEEFYITATSVKNNSAIKSYEKYAKLKPFILNGRRICTRFKFRDAIYRYTVTGFAKESVYVVAHLLADWNKSGEKKLLNFSNKEWLLFRKGVK